MKRIGILLVAAALSLGAASCTNDEGEPEFEILNPQDNNEETAAFPESHPGEQDVEPDVESGPAGN